MGGQPSRTPATGFMMRATRDSHHGVERLAGVGVGGDVARRPGAASPACAAFPPSPGVHRAWAGGVHRPQATGRLQADSKNITSVREEVEALVGACSIR